MDSEAPGNKKKKKEINKMSRGVFPRAFCLKGFVFDDKRVVFCDKLMVAGLATKVK